MSVWKERPFFGRLAGPPFEPLHLAPRAHFPVTPAEKEVHVVVMSAVWRTFLCVTCRFGAGPIFFSHECFQRGLSVRPCRVTYRF